MQPQVHGIPKFNYKGDVKHDDLYIFEGDVIIISLVSKITMGL
jgi:hypothetical protein